ncbi:TIM-barrel domain-containing protein [Faecalicatena contorta]|uniref:Alpha-D-xyloside xylohydrolase n=1 Tax=Faecalicatena contorta TaxID=39482 RepID=A0A315ZZF3_9FIRM|nr:TIM-barrel domain-containing protein [Faecalicatena contorta]PWJ50713.1 alpha-D-xyloside xylohydrolase [Faecalicatena contorta]SUQ13281.1 alpha-D-xyloside xylohydrolase [Faecalicatena contorta]
MIKKEDRAFIRRYDAETLRIESWGANSLRIRATHNGEFLPVNSVLSALTEVISDTDLIIEEGEDYHKLIQGKLTCMVGANGKLTFYHSGTGKKLLEEYDRNEFNTYYSNKKTFNSSLAIPSRSYSPIRGTSYYKIVNRFEGDEEERLFGMGQYQQSILNLNGAKLELSHRNSQASVPFLLSDKGYGMLWNNPGVGEVFFGKNRVEWIASSTRQIDYWITAGDMPAEIEEAYAKVVGKAPLMPDYGLGLWQCKLRYRTQEELMSVAREYRQRGLPLDVIVADYFHWPNQGDFRFDEVLWPDVEGMTKELEEMGTKLIVSVWPTVEKNSENYEVMKELGYLTRNDSGDRQIQLGDAATIDFTNPEARAYVWDLLKKNYLDKGVHDFWLDEAEPEFNDYDYMNYRYQAGADMEVGNIYPREYIKMAYEGMKEAGHNDQIHLIRCVWLGSQKYGALLWSGDIDSSFRALREQVYAGLNVGIAGIPWWTTDIGGFEGADIRDESFKECLVRWFQFATFCPVLRMHGFRKPVADPIGDTGGARRLSGAPNELWSYGEEVYQILKHYLKLRLEMKSYLQEVMTAAHEKGTPPMRPMFYEFPSDKRCWDLKDQYMFGPDYLVAPILEEGMRSRQVYLPAGKWRRVGSDEEYDGGKVYEVEAPLADMPVFKRQS